MVVRVVSSCPVFLVMFMFPVEPQLPGSDIVLFIILILYSNEVYLTLVGSFNVPVIRNIIIFIGI